MNDKTMKELAVELTVETTYDNLSNKCGTIRRMLIASVTTAKKK